MAIQRKKRRLKTTHDPVMNVGQGKRASVSAGVTRKGAAAAGTKPAGTKPAGTKPRTTKAATHPADAKFDSERKQFLDGKKGKAKASVVKKDITAQLADRMKAHEERLANHKKAADLQMQLIGLREKVQKDNLAIRQKASKANTERRLAARLKAMQGRKPKIDGGKIVTPKVEKPTYTKVDPKLKAMPRIANGKITYKPRVPKTPDAGAAAAGRKGAVTRRKSGKKEA